MTASKEAEPDRPRRACARCDREVEDCSFCGEPDCPAPECYADMLAGLGVGMVQPHTHGG